MRVLRHFGYEDTTIHVLYEVFTPFVVYLLAERLGVSGILAVVAAGLVMAERAPRLMSASAAKQQLVSDNFWRIIEFLINGIVFVMLGMQLPLARPPGLPSCTLCRIYLPRCWPLRRLSWRVAFCGCG